jgi:hypothetical protein
LEKLNELSLGEKIAGGSGILLLLFSFFPWFTYHGYSGHSGWGGFLSLIGVLLTIVVVAIVLLAKFGVLTLPDKMGNFGIMQVLLAAAGLAFLLILLQVIVGQKVDAGLASVTLSRSIWAYLGVIASAGVAAGVFMMYQAEEKPGPSA